MKRTCEEKQLCGGKLVMNKKTDKQKKVIELVINGTPVSFYDANNENVISALSFLHSVIEILACDNAKLLSSGFTSQITIDKKDSDNLDARQFSNEELGLSSDCENGGQQKSPYSNEPFIYTGNLDLLSLIDWLSHEHDKLIAIRHVITNSKNILNRILEEAGAVIQHQSLINNLHHHPNSSLFLDSNQYSNDLGSILSHLNNHELFHKNYQGINISKEEKPFVKVKES